MRRPGISVALATAALAAAFGAVPAAAAAPRRAVIAFVSAPAALGLLAADPGVEAIGLLAPSQGGYNEQQALLDLTQGAWASEPAYRPKRPPPIALGRDGRVAAWPAVLARATTASAGITPGLLAGATPGGAAYAAAGSRPGGEGVVAADRSGRVAAISLGPARTLTARTRVLLGRFRLVVVAVPDRRRLDQLLAARAPDELVLVLERPPPTAPSEQRRAALLAVGAGGLPGGGGGVRSPTTRRPGLVTAIDIAPSVLAWIGATVPPEVHGQPITREGRRDAAGLARLRARLGVIAGRRWPTIDAFLLAWLAVILGAGAAGRARGRRLALRLGGLAALWTPCSVLVAGALAPPRAVEILVVVGGAFLLAVLNDRLVPWPRAPVAPATAMAVAYAVDLALGSPLIAVSLLGPNPIAGSRFFGVGNELEAALPVVLFAGLAAGLPQRRARPRDRTLFATAGLLVTALVAWGRLGADVGALFTIGGGTAAGALMLGARPRPRKLVLACAVPFVGLAVLAGLDVTTGAGGHFTGTVLHAGSAGDLLDTISRKSSAALRQLTKGVMPINTFVCLAAGAYAWRRPERLLAPTGEAAGWRACLVGGFAGGVLGSLTNDSGPVLLVIATFGLGCVAAYLHGDPRGRKAASGWFLPAS